MDGLECTEIFLSALERTNRIDAEFYRKYTFEVLNELKKHNTKPLTDFVAVSDGNHMGISDKFQNEGIPYYRGQDIHNFFIENANAICIDKDTFNLPYMRRSHLKKGDVLLSIVGTIGEVALVSTDNPMTCNCKLAILRPKSDMLSEYIAVYLKTKYGFNQIDKFKRGAVQMGYLLEDMSQIIVPIFSSDFQNKIKGLILEMYRLVSESKEMYENAKEKLIEILGLSDFKAEDKMYNIKSFSDSFGKTGRLDAEYYQPYYDEFEDVVKKNGFVLASDICEMINYGTVPTSLYTEDGTGIPYIKGMNVKNTEVDNEDLDRIINTESLPNKFFTKQGDIIISQMGTVADCGVVGETQEGWLFASFTIRLRLKKNAGFNPHFVGLYIQELAKKYYFYKNIAQASVRQNTDLPTVNNLYIPKICTDTQNEIANMLIKCKYLKQESKDKLNNSIRAVEIAVESGEKAALNFLAGL